jgi:hypothetical protein
MGNLTRITRIGNSGSGFGVYSWWRSIEYAVGDWRNPGVALIEADDPKDIENVLRVEITHQKIKDAYTSARLKYPHLFTADIDAGAADAVLQYLAFGDLIYG